MTASGSAVADDAQRRGHRETGRAADEQALLAGEPPCHREGVGVADRDHLVGDVPVEGGGPDVLTDAFHQVGAAAPAGVDGALRVRPDDLHLALGHFLEVAAGTGDRATGPDARHEVRDPPVGLPPDLRARPVIMRGGVVGVRVLVRLPAVRCLPGEAAGDAVIGTRVIGRHARGAHDDLGAVGAEHGDLVRGHLVRAGEQAPVTALLSDDRQADARVARGRLHDHAAFAQPALPLGGLYHPQGDAVLHRATRVQVLDLREHVARPRDALRHRLQPQQGGVPHRLGQRVVHLHGFSFCGPTSYLRSPGRVPTRAMRGHLLTWKRHT